MRAAIEHEDSTANAVEVGFIVVSSRVSGVARVSTLRGTSPMRMRGNSGSLAALSLKICNTTDMADPALVTTTLLLERLRDSRDADAWTTFDHRFRGVILATALKLGLAEADAADAAQETILQVLRDYQAGKYDRSRGRLSSWIIAIAHHRIVDIVRARRNHYDLTKAGSIPENDPTTFDVASAFDDALERRTFEHAWERIQVETKFAALTLLAFELSALRQVPPAQVAERCKMSVEQVYVSKNRVSRRLQEIVEELSRVYCD